MRGGATLVMHPSRAGVEKIIYDINPCNRYISRWNISADLILTAVFCWPM